MHHYDLATRMGGYPYGGHPNLVPGMNLGPSRKRPAELSMDASTTRDAMMHGAHGYPAFIPYHHMPHTMDPTAYNLDEPTRKKNRSSGGLGGARWTADEDRRLRAAIAAVGPQNWKLIAAEFLGNSRSDIQCLHRCGLPPHFASTAAHRAAARRAPRALCHLPHALHGILSATTFL